MPISEDVDVNLLPYGNPDFSDIREKNKIYVDKTALIYKIACQDTPIFFSRPRRFGKSLLINTLSNLFTDGLKNFKGLEIEKKWTDKQYSVVHLDFSSFAEKNPNELKEDLGEAIINKFKMRGIVSQKGEAGIRNPDRILDEICDMLNNNSIVLLIDEYDSPLTHHINDKDELKEITKILNNFYSVIKQYTGKFRLIFITGVTRASHISIFSAFNNLKDLSLRDEFNSLLGFTKDELVKYFDPYIRKAAYILKMSVDSVYRKLEHYYDGFQFSLNASETIYNPWSILSFLDSPQLGFYNYWFESGGTPSIILQYLKISDRFDFLDYKNRNLSIEMHKISRKYEISDIPRNILLYQAGYFTLRNENDGNALLVLPNIEVEESLLLLYLEENSLDPSDKLSKKMKDLINEIDSRNLLFIVDVFNQILNECVSNLSQIFNDERSIRDIIYAALIKIPLLQKIKERESAKGKSDLKLITDKTCMVIEFKRTYKYRNPAASLQKALEQLQINRYGLMFSNTHELFRVGMVISTEKKMILPEFCKEI